MKTLFLECKMGASGNMLLSAFYELLPDPQNFLSTMNHLFPNIRVTAIRAETCGITGTHLKIEQAPKAAERSDRRPPFRSPTLEEIQVLISGLPVSDKVKGHTAAIYGRIAEAESHIKKVPVSQVHLHKSGNLNSIAEVAGICLSLSLLPPAEIHVSPIHLGNGQIRCAEGALPVPIPVTAELLKGIPSYCGKIEGELCTPVGAAVLAHFGQFFDSMPPMSVESIGCGVGEKDYPAANCVRAFWGDSARHTRPPEIVELCCHLDDITAESLAFASERLMARGALDVSSSPLTMKKGRAGISLTVICRPEDEERMALAVMQETTTNGLRARHCTKYAMNFSAGIIKTDYGPVQVKQAKGYGICREKPEYESVAALARKKGLPFQQVWGKCSGYAEIHLLLRGKMKERKPLYWSVLAKGRQTEICRPEKKKGDSENVLSESPSFFMCFTILTHSAMHHNKTID